jgi:hypothetical protein
LYRQHEGGRLLWTSVEFSAQISRGGRRATVIAVLAVSTSACS